MSCYIIYYENGAKMMRPVLSESEYRALRGMERQVNLVRACRMGSEEAKRKLVQMNYSCIPESGTTNLTNLTNGCGPLKGCTTPSNSVGMDVDLRREDFANEADYQQAMREIPEKVLSKKDELGLLMLERSVRKGYHIVFKRHAELSQEENLRWASELLGVKYDEAAKDITRVFFTTTDAPEDLLYVSQELFKIPNTENMVEISNTESTKNTEDESSVSSESSVFEKKEMSSVSVKEEKTSVFKKNEMPNHYDGIPYSSIIQKWWELYNHGQEPVKSNRNTLTFELAVNLRHICDFNRELLDQVIPCYDGFSEQEKLACINSALAEKRTQMPKRLRDVLTALKKDNINDSKVFLALEELEQEDDLYYYRRLPKNVLPQGVKESIQATGPKLTMPVLAAVCPMVGALATRVKMLIHGKPMWLNMHSFIVGDAASCKGELDAVVETWMKEEIDRNKLYFSQEEEYRAKKKSAKNAKQQPDEPHLPVRFLTMNNTVPNLCDRLANTDGQHAFSYTPEADTVAQRWRSLMSDFSTMLRQSYDGSRYDREAKSAEATTVHIEHLLWNVCMCGTPDALYRVLSNTTDGLLSRFVIAHTPDNTFAPLEEKPALMTDLLRDRILQVAHLLPLMQGTLDLPKLEQRCRDWVERVRREALLDDDRVRARARLRDHTTAMRMTGCLILCSVAEKLIKKHGLTGAELLLKKEPGILQEWAVKCQTPEMLDVYEVLAESLIDNDMYYFREKLERAQESLRPTDERVRRGKNDHVFDRLGETFTFDQALAARGHGCTRNAVQQMLKNWKAQGLICVEGNKYQKL